MTPARKTSGTHKGLLAGGLVLAACTVLVLAYAVGAVVPAVGDALSMDQSGVGYLFGYLFGAIIVGLVALLLLIAAWDPGGTPPAAELPAPQPIHPPVALPDGPGLATRWSMAVPVMLLAAFGPLSAAIVLGAAARLTSDELAAAAGVRPVPAFGAELSEMLATVWPIAFLPATVTAGFLWWHNRMAS
jgi:hypothetical protein